MNEYGESAVSGHYIVLEGDDATGKSTQLKHAREDIAGWGGDVLVVEEPGGSEFADALRGPLKNGDIDRDPVAEYLAFQAAGVDMWNKTAEPALEKGTHVLAGRNHESRKIYQGRGRGVSLELIDTVNRLTMPKRYLKPSRFIVLMILDPIIREQRLAGRAKPLVPDAFEDQDAAFHERIHQGYVDLSHRPGVTVVDASGTEEEVRELVREQIKPLIERR